MHPSLNCDPLCLADMYILSSWLHLLFTHSCKRQRVWSIRYRYRSGKALEGSSLYGSSSVVRDCDNVNVTMKAWGTLLILVTIFTLGKSQCTPPCVNGGTCVSGSCNCLQGFNGTSCELSTVDFEPPVLVCPNRTLVNNSDVARWEVPIATDNSGEVTLLSSHIVGEYFPLGNTTVTYMARDKYGLETNCSFVVEVVADGSPLITNCPSDQLLEVDAGVTSVSATWTPPVATTDQAGGALTRTSDYEPGDAFRVGPTTVTYTFVDQVGQVSQCFFVIMVVERADVLPPSNMSPCPNDIIKYLPPGVTETTVTWDEPTFNDIVDGGDLYVSQTKQSGSVFPQGSTQVLYVAMDKNYNTLECMFTVSVNVTIDNTPPVISGCPANITRWVTVGTNQAVIQWTPPTASDDYGTPTLVASAQPGSVFPLGSFTVNYTATDTVQNTAVCEFVVTVAVDNEDPIITGCPGNIVQYVKADVTAATVTWSTPNATDNSGRTTFTSNLQSGQVFQASTSGQTTRVTIIVSDDYGNSALCTFTVAVITDEVPVINCPSTVSRDNAPGQPYADVSWTEVTVTDDFTSVSRLQISTSENEPLRVNFDSPAVVTYSATDERGNIATCTFTVIVNDVEPPVWQICPQNITQPLDDDTNSAIVSWTVPSVSDNSGVSPTITRNPSSPELFYPGTYVVRYTANDGARPPNEATCEFFVTVTADANVPVFDNCPLGPLNFNTPAGSASAVVMWPVVTVTDDTDSNVPITSNYSPGQTLDIGTYNVEYRAMDNAGNTGYCGFTINVIDAEDPVFTFCPSDRTVYIADATRDVRASWVTPTATDNSGTVTVTLVTTGSPSGTRFNAGSRTIEYRATDPSGNSINRCRFVINVEVKANTIVLNGQLVLDVVRGLDGVFTDSSRQDNLADDLDDLFRSTSLSDDFVGIRITDSSFNSDNNFVIAYDLHLCDPSRYNEEDIKEIFNSALIGGNNNAFPTANAIVSSTFDLNVVEFRGQFVLRSIANPGTVPVDFQACCSDPSSASYRDLVSRVYAHMDQTYSGEVPFRMVRILFLSAGSVAVDYTLTFDVANSPGANTIERMFNDTVTAGTFELSLGADTGLYLVTRGVTAGSVQGICPGTDYCQNGGTCSITNTTSYEFGCSCPYGYSGDRCQNTFGLRLEVIIGIAVGVVALLLLILILCCCCCVVMIGGNRYGDAYTSRRTVHRSKERPVQQVPLILIPEEEYYYVNKPKHAMVDEIGRKDQRKRKDRKDRKSRVKGPMFHHENNGFLPDPTPDPPVKTADVRPGHVKNIYTPEPSVPKKHREKGPKFHTDFTEPKISGHKKHKPKGPMFHVDEEPEPIAGKTKHSFQDFNY